MRKGGVLIAVRDCFVSRLIVASIDSVEHLFKEVQLGHKHIIIGAVYFPLNSNIYLYESHCLKC